jgi:hypothetical protein
MGTVELLSVRQRQNDYKVRVAATYLLIDQSLLLNQQSST